jgi:hypothetical protein
MFSDLFYYSTRSSGSKYSIPKLAIRGATLVISLLIYSKLGYAVSIINTTDEALVLACQTKGYMLYHSCVEVPPITTEQVAWCTSLKLAYITCLRIINTPYPLVISTDPDPYSMSPFTPCTYETGHSILYTICPNNIP